jgi:hypothetical protein
MSIPSKLGCIAMAAAAVAGVMPVAARAAVIVDTNSTPTLVSTWAIGQASGFTQETVTAGALYSDDTTFSGYAVNAGGSGTTKYTGLLADDINTIATSSFTLGQFTFSISNIATVAQTISPYVRFFDTTGSNGGPGNLLGGINFNGISIASDAVDGFNYNASSLAITLPTSFWACEYFSTTGSAANAEKIGEGTFNPVDVGSSNDEDFSSTSVASATSTFTSANPAGTVNVSPFGGTPVANFEWEFNAAAPVPEPAALALLAPSALLGLSRRRRAI